MKAVLFTFKTKVSIMALIVLVFLTVNGSPPDLVEPAGRAKVFI